MNRVNRKESPLVDNRYLWAGIGILFVFATLTIRLWHIQIYKGDYYQKIAVNNRIRRIEIPAPRGTIYDSQGEIILGNRPFYDLVYIPQYIRDKEKTLQIISTLLQEPVASFERSLRASQGRPKFLPITIKRNLSLHEVSLIESSKIALPGIEINTAPRRDYSQNTPAHLVGYIGEISASTLKEYNKDSKENPYLPGDLIGKQGLESRWESHLRGQRGYRLIQVDAFGRQTTIGDGDETWNLPIKPAIPGSDLILSIDLELQKATKDAFQGKYGAVVVMNPQNGEILALLSSPDFDPTIYQDGISFDKWQSLISDPYKPLFDKTTGGAFAPGSVYKPLVAFAALEEGIIDEKTTYQCNGSFELGRDIFHCHHRGGHGKVDLQKAMVKSCDVYFYHLGVELGIDKIAKYARDFGLGEKLGVQLNKEDPGLIPTNEWKKTHFKRNYTIGDSPPISIGQGANLLTPIQIASLYASIANGGKVWRPIIVKRITNHVGETALTHTPKLIKTVDLTSQKSLSIMRKVLGLVVSSHDGSGRRSRVQGQTVAGKTGSAQVVSLKKNRNRKSSIVSMKWQEHAMFAAFSPVENAEIVVAVVSENDRIGGGGTSASPIAGKILKAYWDLKDQRAQKKIAMQKKEKNSDSLK